MVLKSLSLIRLGRWNPLLPTLYRTVTESRLETTRLLVVAAVLAMAVAVCMGMERRLLGGLAEVYTGWSSLVRESFLLFGNLLMVFLVRKVLARG